MIRLQLSGVRELELEFKEIPKRVHESLARTILRLVIGLQRYIITNKLEGQVLHHRTGNLERNIVYEVQEDAGRITGFVGVGVGAPYGKLHELGGTVDIREQVRTSRKGKSFTVRAHRATFPQRAFLGPSLDENAADIETRLTQAIQSVL